MRLGTVHTSRAFGFGLHASRATRTARAYEVSAIGFRRHGFRPFFHAQKVSQSDCPSFILFIYIFS